MMTFPSDRADEGEVALLWVSCHFDIRRGLAVSASTRLECPAEARSSFATLRHLQASWKEPPGARATHHTSAYAARSCWSPGTAKLELGARGTKTREDLAKRFGLSQGEVSRVVSGELLSTYTRRQAVGVE